MKKIMIMMAVACAAMFANAASFNWKLQTGAGYDGMSVYAVTGSSAASVLAALQSETATDWTDALAGVTPYAVDGNTSRSGAVGKSTDIAAGNNLVYVIVDGAVAEGSKFWVVNDYSIPAANVFEPPATGTQATIKTSDLGFAGQGTFTAVPEPTSGLLMLVGLAGLALRRRRA